MLPRKDTRQAWSHLQDVLTLCSHFWPSRLSWRTLPHESKPNACWIACIYPRGHLASKWRLLGCNYSGGKMLILPSPPDTLPSGTWRWAWMTSSGLCMPPGMQHGAGGTRFLGLCCSSTSRPSALHVAPSQRSHTGACGEATAPGPLGTGGTSALGTAPGSAARQEGALAFSRCS